MFFAGVTQVNQGLVLIDQDGYLEKIGLHVDEINAAMG